jgi:hypothetical protein
VNDLAQKANVTTAEALALKGSASQAAGTINLIQAEFGLEEAEVDQLRDAGITGLRDMTAASDTLSAILGADRAATVGTLLDLTMNRSGFTPFR